MNAGGRDRVDRVVGLVGKELRQVLRDRRMARVIFLVPVLQLVVFGYAASTDLWATPTAIVDHDRTLASRAVVDALTASGYFRVRARVPDAAALIARLDRGDALLGVEIPVGFARALQAGDARVQLLLDGTSSNTASVAQGYAERILAAHGRTALGVAPEVGLELRERAWFNAELASRNYNVPAVVGALVLLICLLLTSLAVVRERELGTLEQLRVSPMTPGELILGKTIPFALIGLVDLLVVVTLALAWFDVPFRGSAGTLLLASVLYVLSGLGIGLLISTISTTQQEAFMASFLVFMPAILLSGFMFPVSSMPAPFQWLTLANPMRHYVESVRAVFLKGVGVRVLWPQLAALAALGGGLLWLAARRFREGS